MIKIIENLNFKECNVCAAKAGTPTLCAPCIHNRHVIATLKKNIEEKEMASSNIVNVLNSLVQKVS